jgi:molybdate transport system regulatory protein
MLREVDTVNAAHATHTPLLSIHIDLDGGLLDPLMIALLESIDQEGSISAAGRALKIPYKRAWERVAVLNRSFDQRLVRAQPGGLSGGGAMVTECGRELVRHYRALEREVRAVTTAQLRVLQSVAARQP